MGREEPEEEVVAASAGGSLPEWKAKGTHSHAAIHWLLYIPHLARIQPGNAEAMLDLFSLPPTSFPMRGPTQPCEQSERG